MVQFLLQQCTRWNGIHEKNNVKDDFNCSKLAPLLKHESRKEYLVNPLYNPIVNDRSEIMLQNSKLKVFYFKSGETSALIMCFKDEISKNKSEFRFMPEDDDVFSDNDYSEIYDLKYEDTINKFRGIEGMSIDPFKLSKFLGKYLRIGSMIDDKVESSFAKDILKIFYHHTIIAHVLKGICKSSPQLSTSYPSFTHT